MSVVETLAEHLTQPWRAKYLDQLLNWYARHQRDLPWRKTRDPYAIWISESMLQQTQVATVIDYYARFLQRFPDVQALAAADEQEVMSMWAGLGYYRRARQLHAAAQRIMADHAGTFPVELADILKLPGVGRYTAGAVASIAHGQAAPIVEANTQRLYARLMRLEQPLAEPAAQRKLWEFAQWQLEGTGTKPKSREKRSPGTINQAVMELGALICKPTNPQCLICPLVDLCPTAQAGLQQRIPAPKPKRQFTALHHIALVVRQQGRWLLRCNPPGGWWHGLWDFPRVDVTELGLSGQPGDKKSSANKKSAPNKLAWSEADRQSILKLAHRQLLSDENLQVFTALQEPLVSLSHGVTRYRIRLDGLSADADHNFFHSQPQWKWVTVKTAEALPLTATAKKMLSRF